MNGSMAIALLLGVLAGLIFTAVILKLTKKDGALKCKYDERQDRIRGKGFKFSFFTLLIYDALYGMLGIAVEKPRLDAFAAMMLGICIAIAVYVIYCIWHDAYFSLNENPRKVLIALALIGVVNILVGIINFRHGEAFTNGVLNFRSTNFMCGILFIAIFLALLVRKIKNKSEAE